MNETVPDRQRAELRETEVVVVGSGPAAAMASLVLARRGIRVAILQDRPKPSQWLTETLPAVGCRLLRTIGLDCDGEGPFWMRAQSMLSAWGSNELAERHSLFEPHGGAVCVYRRWLDTRLVTIAEKNGAVVLPSTRYLSAEPSSDGYSIAVRRADRICLIHAARIVDASGRRSIVASSLGAQRVRHDRLIGLVAVLPPTCEPGKVGSSTMVESFERGWWYSLPQPDGSLVAGCMMDSDDPWFYGRRPMNVWREALAMAPRTRSRLVEFGPPIRIHGRDASTSTLELRCGSHWLAVGDAATSHDPLSGQGLYVAMKGAMNAGEALADELATGSQRALLDYENATSLEFARFLAKRVAYYDMEQRWPKAMFWERRHHNPITNMPVELDPMMRVRLVPNRVSAQARAAAMEVLLHSEDGRRLVQLCEIPQLAHEIVRHFCETETSRNRPETIIRALQVMLADGMLEAC